MEWIKPSGAEKFHIVKNEKTLCGRNFIINGKNKKDENPLKENLCDECVEKAIESDA